MRIEPTEQDLIDLTHSWQGDRFANGRPKVSDEVLELLRRTTTEQAWQGMLAAGHLLQFAGNWRETHPGTITVGRAVTAQFLPHRPDFDTAIVRAGEREGHLEGDRQNSWVIESLQENDVMVVDIFGKVREGTVIGDNLATAVASRTHAGAVIHGGIRDFQGIAELESVNIYHRGVDPTPIRNVTLAGMNIPIRIGEATVLPGDIVLGTPSGVMFIPPHLAESVATESEDIRIRDLFGKQRLSEQTYTSAEIDVGTWATHIEDDFAQWRQDNA